MKGDLGTILYIVFLIIISLAGVFKKKKKVDEEELKKKVAQTQGKEAADIPAGVAEKIITGNPLVDALLNTPEEPEMQMEEEIPAYGEMTEEPPEKEEPEEFLPPEEEGRSVFAAQKEEKKPPVDKNRIAADQPDWQKFMDEQNREEGPDIMEDFDPVKAVIYSEIMERKYF